MPSQDDSEASSYDSDHCGDVARAGFTRMYVLLHSAESPFDLSLDYRGEGETAKCDDSRLTGRRKRYGALEGEFDDDDQDQERFQLMYVNGGHYFHGTIALPDTLTGGDRQNDKFPPRDGDRRAGLNEGDSIDVEDLVVLLPHFQEQHDALTCVDHVSHFRQELRDVVYQMEEVGEFMVEELSKDRIIRRIEEGSREFHWMVSPQNPTFFELQTHRRTNESMDDAGVVLIVLKLIVRGVLLDVIYHNDSYFISLRENADELALEDSFIPNNPELTIQGSSRASVGRAEPKEQQLHLPAQTSPQMLKVAPAHSISAPPFILQANDSQLYCLFPTSNPSKRQKPTKKCRSKYERDDTNDEDIDQECSVVLHFNKYIYHGTATVKHAAMDDLGKLSSCVLPDLKAQAIESLSFFGPSLSERSGTTELPVAIQWTNHVRARFESIAATLLDLVTEAQAWIEKFIAEIDIAANESAKSTEGVAWLGSHLRGWLENADGSECFFELETSVAPTQLWGSWVFDDDEELRISDVSLIVWKGIVNQAVMVVVYRRGSFFVVLRELEDVARLPRDGLEFFGLLPPLESKGRGYLVRALPSQIPRRSQQWLSGAKLLLWQTKSSVAREDRAAEDAQAKWLQSPSKRDEEKETAAWFEDGDTTSHKPLAREADVRKAERVDEEKEAGVKALRNHQSPPSAQRQREKTGRRHHLAPMAQTGRYSMASVGSVPWDTRTGQPL